MIEGRCLSFDHDYATEVIQKCKAHTGIKRLLKEKGIRFQNHLDKMRIHWDSGTRTYESAQEECSGAEEEGYSVTRRQCRGLRPGERVASSGLDMAASQGEEHRCCAPREGKIRGVWADSLKLISVLYLVTDQFFPVSRPEHPLLLVKKSFQVIGDPRLIIREAAYSSGWHGGVFTEPDVFCNAVSHAVGIHSMWLNKYIPVCWLKASAASWVHLLTLPVWAGCRWTRGTYFGVSRTRLWSDPPRGEGCGTVCILSICIRKIQCVIISGGTVNILVKCWEGFVQEERTQW